MSNLEIYNTPTGKRAVYYHTNWSGYARNFQVKDIPDCVYDVAYAFWNLNPDGSIVSGDPWADYDKRYTGGDGVSPADNWNDNSGVYGNFGQLKKLRDSGRKLNVNLSLGGWTWSKNFSPAVSNQTTRTNLVNNIINIFKKYPIFTGVSLDWEYVSNDGVNHGLDGNSVSPNDSSNFILFLKQLRQSFTSEGMGKYIISMCCVADPNKAKFDVENTHPHIDELHIMTYDFHDGAWGETISGHHTNPRKSSFSRLSCEEAADYYISRGVPSTKCYIGAAFYSRGFANTSGIGQSSSGGSPDQSWDKGSVDYKGLPVAGATEFFDEEAKAAYSYDPVKMVINSYDNVESVKEKCKIIYEKNLGGIIIWENSADTPINNKRSLVATLKNNLTHGKVSNTPNTKPTTVPTTPVPTTPVPTPVPTPTPKPTPTSNPTLSFTKGEKLIYKNVEYTCLSTVMIPNIYDSKTWKAKPLSSQLPLILDDKVPVVVEPPVVVQPVVVEWKDITLYSVNSIVTYKGVRYSCMQGHTSNIGWVPDLTSGILWKRV
jgi:chitinase